MRRAYRSALGVPLIAGLAVAGCGLSGRDTAATSTLEPQAAPDWSALSEVTVHAAATERAKGVQTLAVAYPGATVGDFPPYATASAESLAARRARTTTSRATSATNAIETATPTFNTTAIARATTTAVAAPTPASLAPPTLPGTRVPATPGTVPPPAAASRPVTRLPPGADSLTLAGVHFAGSSAHADEVFGGTGLRGWAVELVYTEDGFAPADVAARMRGLRERGFTPILRADYARGQAIPPADDAEAVARYADALAAIVSGAGGALRHVVVGNEPNIDEAGVDPQRNTECRLGRATCAPDAYARVYRIVRARLAAVGAEALVAGVSPGTDAHPARWMGGPEYLAALLAELAPGQVDGIALHAYGLEAEPVPGLPPDRLAYFQALVRRQREAIDGAGHAATPLYITEMNEYTDPTAAFMEAAYGWLGAENARRGGIRAAAWFTYDGEGAWDHLALRNAPEDVRAAFRRAASLHRPGR